MIKHSFAILENCFVKLFNLILTAGCVPNIWYKGLITPVHKKRDSSNPDNFRPTCVLSCLCKMITNCLNSRLVSVCKKEKLIHVSQIGFGEGYRTTDHIFSLTTVLKYALEKPSGKLYACFIDFKKAYDSVWHKSLFSKLENLNIGGTFVEIIKDMYENSKCAVKIQNKVTNFSRVTEG